MSRKKKTIGYQYLQPHDGPVFNGLEAQEIVYAKDQPEYIPLRTVRSDGPEKRVISRWTPTPEQRKAIAKGADIFLTLLTYGGPLQPIQVAISDDQVNTDWIKVCLLDQSASEAKVQ